MPSPREYKDLNRLKVKGWGENTMEKVNQREWDCSNIVNVAVQKCGTRITKATDSQRKIRNVYFYFMPFKIKMLAHFFTLCKPNKISVRPYMTPWLLRPTYNFQKQVTPNNPLRKWNRETFRTPNL